jgi:putative ABC transport system permease protein
VAINFGLPIYAMLGGAVLVTAAGWFAATRLIDAPPLEALRAGG